MPFVQLWVCLDNLWVLQEPVAEVIDDGGDGEDAT
jgi:ABC-type transport system involved in cytochrome c biogenesis ATPase subunit